MKNNFSSFAAPACISILTLGLLCGAAAPLQESDSVLSTEEQIKEEFLNVPCRSKERQAGVRALFQRMGAPSEAVTVEKPRGIENVTVQIPGRSDEKIIIGAHYDFVDSGCGAVDNWTGIVAMAHAYRSIRKLPIQKTVQFVAFGREEEGLLGSKAMVREIPKEKVPEYCAMINIDSFGLARPFAMENTSSPNLMKLAKATAESMGIPFYTVPIRAGNSDSSSFLERKIPAITLSGLSNEWGNILHTRNDQTSKVIPLSVYLGYRLALAMWSKIDAQPCATYKESR